MKIYNAINYTTFGAAKAVVSEEVDKECWRHVDIYMLQVEKAGEPHCSLQVAPLHARGQGSQASIGMVH